MKRRRKGFGSYAIRRAGQVAKDKWEVRIKGTALAAATEAKWMAAEDRLSRPVCVFDLSRWDRKPVCFQRSGTVNKYARKRHVPGLGLRNLVRRVTYTPGERNYYAPVKSSRAT